MEPEQRELLTVRAADGGLVISSSDIARFFQADQLTEALRANSFDVQEEMSRLIDLSRSADPKTSLAAMRQLATRIREVAELSGMIGRAAVEETTNAQGEVSTRRIASRLIVKPPSSEGRVRPVFHAPRQYEAQEAESGSIDSPEPPASEPA